MGKLLLVGMRNSQDASRHQNDITVLGDQGSQP